MYIPCVLLGVQELCTLLHVCVWGFEGMLSATVFFFLGLEFLALVRCLSLLCIHAQVEIAAQGVGTLREELYINQSKHKPYFTSDIPSLQAWNLRAHSGVGHSRDTLLGHWIVQGHSGVGHSRDTLEILWDKIPARGEEKSLYSLEYNNPTLRVGKQALCMCVDCLYLGIPPPPLGSPLN